MGRLAGKTAIITGGAGGIGRAAAGLFVREGARVVVADLEPTEVDEVVSMLGPEHAAGFVGDVTVPSDNEAMVSAAVDRFGSLDVFVANAGIEGPVAAIAETDPGEFDRVMAVNVRGVFLGLRAAMPAMAASGGSIIITSSGAGVRGVPGLAAYTASKAALIGLMRTAALEGAPSDIRVNSIHPSAVETDMMRRVERGFSPSDAATVKERVIEDLPFRRYGTPAEIAEVMVFLASDAASWVSGSVQMVDGAETA